MVPASVLSGIMLPGDLIIDDAVIFSASLPNSSPAIKDSGVYIFAFASAEVGTGNFISNIATVNIFVN